MKTASFVLTALLLASCGGGGSSSPTTTLLPTPTPTPATTPFLDSFGNDASGAGFAGGDSGADGSAGDGSPAVGATVTFTDANGKTVSAITDSKGYYRVKITGFAPPFVVKVTETNGKVRYSLNVKPLKTNGFLTVDITGLTDKIASDVALAGGQAGASKLTPAIVASNSGAITTSVNNLKTLLSGVITSAGLDPVSFDPLSAVFVPNHTGYDFILDNTVITTDSKGATTIAISPTYVPQTNPSQVTTLAGNWQQQLHYVRWSLNSALPADPASTTVVGANVPASVAFTNNWIASLAPQTSTSGGITTTIAYASTGANSFRMTITVSGSGTTSSQTYDYVFTNFSGCGACGVGSSVSYTMTLTGDLGSSGVFTAVVTNTFTRLN